MNVGASRSQPTMIYFDEKEKECVMGVMRKHNQRGHGFMNDEDRYEIMVLKGMHKTFSHGGESHLDVFADIQEQVGEAKVDGEYRYREDVMMKLEHPTSNYIVRSKSKQTMNEITALRKICFARPVWEEMRKQEVVQCYQCYELGHSC